MASPAAYDAHPDGQDAEREQALVSAEAVRRASHQHERDSSSHGCSRPDHGPDRS
jgi:hypothetical protein